MANPNPSPSTRFKKGNRANPGGKTTEQKQMEVEAAHMALQLRHKMLSAMMEKAEEDGADLRELLDMTVLRLLKDSEDRAHGTPQASTVLKGDEANPLKVEQIERLIVKSTD